MNETLTKPQFPRTSSPRGQRPQFLTPSANIFEDKDGYVVQVELPGVAKDGLRLTVENGELAVEGKRRDAKTDGTWLYRESRDLDFRRTFELDPSIDTSKVSARLDQGVLTLSLPKSEAVKPRDIPVTD